MTAKKRIDLDHWEEAVDAIHRLVADKHTVVGRLRKIADLFVGRPYVINSLIGGPEEPEKLVVNFKAFDCVTFIESTLALARSRSRREFITELKNSRYRNGVVDWRSRLHYFSDWMIYNEKRQTIKRRTRGSGSRSIVTTMGLIYGFPPRRIRIQVVPKQDMHLALKRIRNGSIVAFASLRPRLDFFHTGLLFSDRAPARSIEELVLYSPPKSIGKVIKEPLPDFLKRNRMRGLAFAEIRETGDLK